MFILNVICVSMCEETRAFVKKTNNFIYLIFDSVIVLQNGYISHW